MHWQRSTAAWPSFKLEGYHLLSGAAYDTPLFTGTLICKQSGQCTCLLPDRHTKHDMPARVTCGPCGTGAVDTELTRGAWRRGQLWHRVRAALAAPQALIAVRLHVPRRCALHASVRTHAERSGRQRGRQVRLREARARRMCRHRGQHTCPVTLLVSAQAQTRRQEGTSCTCLSCPHATTQPHTLFVPNTSAQETIRHST